MLIEQMHDNFFTAKLILAAFSVPVAFLCCVLFSDSSSLTVRRHCPLFSCLNGIMYVYFPSPLSEITQYSQLKHSFSQSIPHHTVADFVECKFDVSDSQSESSSQGTGPGG